MDGCRSHGSAIRVRCGSWSFRVIRNCGPAHGRDIIDRPARACFGWMRRLPWQMRNSIAKRARQCGHRWASLAEWIAPELKGE